MLKFSIHSYRIVYFSPILQNQALNVMKRKMEADLTRLSNENEELISEFRVADERAKKAVTDVSLALTFQKHSALIQLPVIKDIFLGFFHLFPRQLAWLRNCVRSRIIVCIWKR